MRCDDRRQAIEIARLIGELVGPPIYAIGQPSTRISGLVVVMVANRPYGLTIRSGVTKCRRAPPPGGRGKDSCSRETSPLTAPISTARAIFAGEMAERAGSMNSHRASAMVRKLKKA